MSIKRENICRLCLNVVTNEFSEIDEVMVQTFDILSLKLDLNITGEPIMCYDCVEIAKKCLKFKSTCLTTERVILSYSIDWENVKHNIKVIYREREKVEIDFDEELHICRICMTRLERNKFACLDTLKTELTMFDMLAQYMLEVDVNIIEDPVICTTCTEKLDDYFKFVANCLDTERKITAFCKAAGNENNGQITLGNVLHFLFKHFLEHPEKYSQICAIKEERNMFEETKCVFPEVYNELIQIEVLDIKEEVNLQEDYYKDLLETGVDKSTKSDTSPNIRDVPRRCTYQKEIPSNIVEDSLIHEDTLKVDKSEISDLQINKHAMVTDVKKNIRMNFITCIASSDAYMYKYGCTSKDKRQSALKEHIEIHGASVCKAKNKMNSNKIHKCSLCAYETRDKSNLKKHMLVHKDVSEVDMHKCSICAYETKYKRSLRYHLLLHKDVSEVDMHKCSLCAYETRDKNNLKKHMLVHKDVSEVDMHKCSICAYETRHKRSLRNHLLVHKDVSEVDMHKCSICAYETKHKGCLRNHLLVHKEVSEVDMQKCSICAYETKHKSSLRSHLLVHKDVSEVDMHKCSVCTYETKRKSNLKSHMFVHQNIPEIARTNGRMHECSICTFRTKRRTNLKSHMMVHQDISEIKMYKCLLCGHEFKEKKNLRSHMLRHKEVSEVKMYKCSMCAQEMKNKRSLKRHMLLHKDVSEVAMYKCSMCMYETKFKSSLKDHMLVHKDISEIDIHKCSMCTYGTRFKSNLKSHMLIHKNNSEIDMHKCLLCTYQSKYKCSLKTHMVVHHQNISKKKHKS